MNLTLEYVKNKSANRIVGLLPVVQAATVRLIERTYALNIPILITQGLRTYEEQDKLYAQGRTTSGKIVTNAKGGYSNHNFGVAIDFCLLLPDGKNVSWDTLRDGNLDLLPDWVQVVDEAKKLGFLWGGDWRSFKDLPHFEMTFGITTAQFRSGKKPTQLQIDNAYKLINSNSGVDTVLAIENNKVYKERVYLSNGSLIRCDGNYKVTATDVRYIKFPTGDVRYQFVYEKGAKVSDLVKKYGADYGFNATFFYNSIPLGDVKIGDKVISEAYGKMLKWHEFAVKDSKPEIGQLNKNEKYDFLIQGSPLLVENGQLVYEKYRVEQEVNDDIGKSRCQRTFVGIDRNGDLLLFIGDGRTGSDQGLTLQEAAIFAQSKGCVNAINFDGGGSTIFADRTGGINQKLNTGANERVVNHAVLVYLNSDKGGEELENDKVLATITKVDLIEKKSGKVQVVDGLVVDGVAYAAVRQTGNYFEAEVGYDAEKKRAKLTK